MQPFVALGKKLQMDGHRVRLATHKIFADFVIGSGLEFYGLGGDPNLLSQMLVRNGGLMPKSFHELAVTRGEFRDILFSTWGACTEPDRRTGVSFFPDAIISNPPASGHIHCAERLGVPLQMVFTMPWSPSREFPHPLSSIRYSHGHRGLLYMLSYLAAENFIYFGVLDIVNKFRTEILQLEPLMITDGGATLLDRVKVPFIYAWSPSLAPKPREWGSHIDVVGFVRMDEDRIPTNSCSVELRKFLEAGPPPVFIGFGSMVIADPQRLTDAINSALTKAGLRVIIQKGWGKLGCGRLPNQAIAIDQCPHTWLFPKCSAVVHHGGAGTLAEGLYAGKPTMVVPFFGDQYLWGQLVAAKGLGPTPLPVEELTEERLLAGLEFLQRPEVALAAMYMSQTLQREDGLGHAVAAFYNNLPPQTSYLSAARQRECRGSAGTPPNLLPLCHPSFRESGDGLEASNGSLHQGKIEDCPEPLATLGQEAIGYPRLDWSSQIYIQPWHGLLLGICIFLQSLVGGVTVLARELFNGLKRRHWLALWKALQSGMVLAIILVLTGASKAFFSMGSGLHGAFFKWGAVNDGRNYYPSCPEPDQQEQRH